MIVPVSGLTGVALDWAVAKAEGIEFKIFKSPQTGGSWIEVAQEHQQDELSYSPSEYWSQAGPLIQKYHAEFNRSGHRMFISSLLIGDVPANGIGHDHLHAFCRALVHSQIGRDVEIPDEIGENHQA